MNRESERKRLTTDKKKIFVRESPTIMSVTKAELHKLYIEIFDRLQEYEVAEETGQIVVPPVKVGDVVYVNPKTWGGLTALNYDNCFIHSEYFLVAEVVSIIKTRKQNLIKLKVYNRTTYTPEYSRYPISSIGKTVFTSREDAVKSLKGADGNV